MAKINELEWSKWNPMATDFYDESQNKYTNSNVREAPDPKLSDANDKEKRNAMQSKYPFLIVKKTKLLITPNVITNFFGRSIIYDLEYRPNSNVYFVYFHNIGSFETARKRITSVPYILNCVDGRPPRRHQLPDIPFPGNKAIEMNPLPQGPIVMTERGEINMINRTIPISSVENPHPMLQKPNLITKAEYAAKGSMLTLNDPNRRYLNVRYEFMLEHYNAYVLKEERKADQVIINYRSGRRFREIRTTNMDELATNTDEIDLKQCWSCGNYTLVSCKFCQMPFCHALCFMKLADHHKVYCKQHKSNEMAKLEKVDNDLSDKPIALGPMKLPPSGSNVKITAFEQSNVVYIRPADIHNDVHYANVLTTVTMQGRKASKLTELPYCGQVVIYKLESQILRAMVLNVDNPEAIYVVCVDFGNIEIVTKPLEHLYFCNDQLLVLPRYAVPVILRRVPQRCISPNLRDMIYELDENLVYEMKYSKRDFDFDKGMQRVMLTELEFNRSLNRLFRTILLPVEPSVSDPGYKEDYLNHVPLPTGKNINLIIMDNSFLEFGFVYCTIPDFAYEITQMQREIQIYGESKVTSRSYAPIKHTLCIAKYQGNWCRGVSLDLVGDGYPSILFLDYGNITPIHITDILPYPSQFTYPILTTEFNIIGLDESTDDKMIKHLEASLPVGAIVNCNEIIYNEEENNYSIRLDTLIESCS